MEKLDVTWTRATKVWWAVLWRSLLYTFLICFPIGIVIGIIAAILGVVEHVRVYANLIGIIIGIPIGIWVFKIVLNKQFNDFQIALVPSNRAILEQGAVQEERQ